MKKIEIELKLSEVRSLALAADVSESDAASLRGQLAGLEVEYRAAVADETVTVDAETRERSELRSRSAFGDYIAAAVLGQSLTGAAAEYAAAEGCPGMLPVALFGAPVAVEHRAITPGPAAGAESTTQPTVPALFARSDSAALGVQFPAVAAGEAHFPVLSTPPPAAIKAAGAAAPVTAGAFTLAKRSPSRVTGQFQVQVEDIALFPSIEADLGTAVQSAVSDAVDSQVLNGTGTAPQLTGLFKAATDVAAAANAETYATGLSRFASLVDGKLAYGWSEIRALIGIETFAKYAALLPTAGGGESLFDVLASKLGALRVSSRAPAKASDAQKGLAILGGSMAPIRVPVWSGVQLIRDIYSGAGTGLVTVTAVTLLGSPHVPHGASQVIEVHPHL